LSNVQLKAGEDNPQARGEEGKLYFIKHGAQLISGWNSQNVGIGILWESHHLHQGCGQLDRRAKINGKRGITIIST